MPAEACSQVTPREAAVLDLLSQGFANDEIGTALEMKTNTVKRHINSAAGKLQIHSRILLARNWGCPLFRIGARQRMVEVVSDSDPTR